jgi:hypothetical protein
VTEAPRLKPQEILGLLDASFRLYRENFALFVGLVALIYIPGQILQMFVTAPLTLEFGDLMAQWQASARTGPDMTLFRQMMGVATILFLVSALVGGIVFPLATGALTLAASRRYLGQPTSLRECYGFIFRNFGRYVGTLLLSGLAAGLGFMCCIVPGILLSVWFVFTSSVVVLEGLGGTAAMGRSRQLSQGSGWRIVGMFLLLMLIAMILGIGSSAFSNFFIQRLELERLHEFMAQQAVQDVITLLLAPFYSVGWILLYYDVRIRNEGFDLEVRLAAPPAEPPPPPTAATA